MVFHQGVPSPFGVCCPFPKLTAGTPSYTQPFECSYSKAGGVLVTGHAAISNVNLAGGMYVCTVTPDATVVDTLGSLVFFVQDSGGNPIAQFNCQVIP